MLIPALAVVAFAGQTPPKPPASPKLVVKDLAPGSGMPAVLGDRLTVDYSGKLTDGKVFDSSKKPGRTPYVFILGLGQVIQGWDKGMVGLKAGGSRKLVVPPDLGYGASGYPPDIPPNATLVFTVTLRKIEHVIGRLKTSTTKAGTGPGLTWGNVAYVKLTGKTGDGNVFIKTGSDMPYGARLQLGRTPLPAGFSLGVLGMRRGEVRTIVVPPDLGFGAEGNPNLGVKPNATLNLTVELMSIESKGAPSGSKDSRE